MDNFTNHSLSWWDEEFMPVEIALDVIHFFIFVVGTTGNGFVIYVYFWSSSLKDTTMKVMVNLAFTDFTTGCMMGIYFVASVTETWSTSFITCMMMEQALTAMMLVSEAVLTIATLDRYISICHNAHYPKILTTRNLNVMLFLAWAIPILLALIPLFGFNEWDNIQICFYSILLADWLYLTYSSVMVTLMIFSLICYLQILVKAHRFYRRLHPAQVQGINARSTKLKRKTQSIRNGKIMGIVVMVFILCWLPFQVDQYNFGTKYFESFSTLTARFTFNLGVLNSLVNPFLYTFQKREFKREVERLLRCIRCKEGEETISDTPEPPNRQRRNTNENEVIASTLRIPHKRGKVHPEEVSTYQHQDNKHIDEESASEQCLPSTSNCNRQIFVTEVEMHNNSPLIGALDTFKKGEDLEVHSCGTEKNSYNRMTNQQTQLRDDKLSHETETKGHGNHQNRIDPTYQGQDEAILPLDNESENK